MFSQLRISYSVVFIKTKYTYYCYKHAFFQRQMKLSVSIIAFKRNDHKDMCNFNIHKFDTGTGRQTDKIPWEDKTFFIRAGRFTNYFSCNSVGC